MSIPQRLQNLSFRTGVVVLLLCVPFYVLSFTQLLLPISVSAKGILWAVLFGSSVRKATGVSGDGSGKREPLPVPQPL